MLHTATAVLSHTRLFHQPPRDCLPQNGSNPQMGSTLGRVGGRIAGANFEIDGVEYKTSANAGNDTMHGG